MSRFKSERKTGSISTVTNTTPDLNCQSVRCGCEWFDGLHVVSDALSVLVSEHRIWMDELEHLLHHLREERIKHVPNIQRRSTATYYVTGDERY